FTSASETDGVSVPIMNGPAPTGCCANEEPSFCTAVGDGMRAKSCEMTEGNCEFAFCRVNWTVVSLTALAVNVCAIFASEEPVAGSAIRLTFATTAAALNGVLSENFSPLRSVIVQTLLSDEVIDLAKPYSTAPVLAFW